MSSSDLYASLSSGGHRSWLGRAEDWLDDRGRGAWIALAVASLVVFWPLGLALSAYIIWSKRMFGKHNGEARAMACGWGRHGGSMSRTRDERMAAWAGARAAMRPSGNAAFDAYKADTLRRLEEEQAQFEAFLARLREAKDKAEFDEFMDDRARRAADRTPEDRAPDAA